MSYSMLFLLWMVFTTAHTLLCKEKHVYMCLCMYVSVQCVCDYVWCVHCLCVHMWTNIFCSSLCVTYVHVWMYACIYVRIHKYVYASKCSCTCLMSWACWHGLHRSMYVHLSSVYALGLHVHTLCTQNRKTASKAVFKPQTASQAVFNPQTASQAVFNPQTASQAVLGRTICTYVPYKSLALIQTGDRVSSKCNKNLCWSSSSLSLLEIKHTCAALGANLLKRFLSQENRRQEKRLKVCKHPWASMCCFKCVS